MKTISILFPLILLLTACKVSTTLSSEQLNVFNGEWLPPCTAPVPDQGYMDCFIEDGTETFVIDSQSGKGKLVSSNSTNKQEYPIEVTKEKDGLFLSIKYEDSFTKGKVVASGPQMLRVEFEQEKMARIWKKK